MQTWIEQSTEAERLESPEWPYRLVTEAGLRFGLSVNDAVRAQREGAAFRVSSDCAMSAIADHDNAAACPNCGQWQRGPSGDRDCLNECVRRGFASEAFAEGR